MIRDQYARFVIRLDGNGAFVAREGSAHSYTKFLQHARRYATREQAERDCCGNEFIIQIEEAFS